VIASTIRGLQHGWTPTSDDAWIALRAHDVFSTHLPLVGTWSSASYFAHRDVNHPGPALFYALSVPVRLFGTAVGTAVGVAIINCLAIALTAWLARRRGGDGFAVAARGATTALLLSMGHNLLFDPWNPFVALLPFLAFLFAVWGAVEGDGPALLVAVICGAFVLQTHLSYVLLVPGLSIVALVGWLRQVRREHRGDLDRTRPTRLQWSLIACVAGVLAWLPPLWQQLTGHPGNLGQLWLASSAHQPHSVSALGALQMSADVLVRPPWWLPPSWLHPTFLHQGHNGGVAAVWAAVAVVCLVALLGTLVVVMRRRGDRVVVSGLIVAFGATLLAVASTLRASAPFGHLADYVRWLWAISLFVWLLVGWCVVQAVSARASSPSVAQRSRLSHALQRRGPRAFPVFGIGVVALMAALTPISPALGSSSPTWTINNVKVLVPQTLARVRGLGPIVVQPSPGSNAGKLDTPALELALTLHHIPWMTTDLITAHQVGMARYVPQSSAPRLVIEYGPAAETPPPGTIRVAYDPRHTVAVLLMPQR
jgi:hypothetical protein